MDKGDSTTEFYGSHIINRREMRSASLGVLEYG